jgi:hypothetical protein
MAPFFVFSKEESEVPKKKGVKAGRPYLTPM